MPALRALRHLDREPLLDLLDGRADTVCVSQAMNSTSIPRSWTGHLAQSSLAIHASRAGLPVTGRARSTAGPVRSQPTTGFQEPAGMTPRFPPSHVPLYVNTGQAASFSRRSRRFASDGFSEGGFPEQRHDFSKQSEHSGDYQRRIDRTAR